MPRRSIMNSRATFSMAHRTATRVRPRFGGAGDSTEAAIGVSLWAASGTLRRMPRAGTEVEEGRQELLGLLGLVGQDDRVAVLRTTLLEVQRMSEHASEVELNRSPLPGEWSPREVLSHLADSDLMVNVRVRMIVTQDRPQLVGYDQEAWTA